MRTAGVVLAILVLSIPVVSAQEIGEKIDNTLSVVSKMLSLGTITVVYSVKLLFLEIVNFFWEDQTDKITETKIYQQWELDNVNSDGECCRSADCLINQEEVCDTRCRDCGSVKEKLERYFD